MVGPGGGGCSPGGGGGGEGEGIVHKSSSLERFFHSGIYNSVVVSDFFALILVK